MRRYLYLTSYIFQSALTFTTFLHCDTTNTTATVFFLCITALNLLLYIVFFSGHIIIKSALSEMVVQGFDYRPRPLRSKRASFQIWTKLMTLWMAIPRPRVGALVTR